MEDKLTVGEIFNEILPKLIEEKPDVVKKINAVISLQLTGSESKTWTIDCKDNPGVRIGPVEDAKCRVIADKDLFEDLINAGKIKPWLEAYKTRAIEVKGSLPTIIRLERLASKLVQS